MDHIDNDSRGGCLAYGVLESHSKEPSGYKKIDVAEHAPSDIDVSKNVEWSTSRREKLTLLTKEQFDKIPDGTLLYHSDGSAFVKGMDTRAIEERDGFVMVGFKKEQLAIRAVPPSLPQATVNKVAAATDAGPLVAPAQSHSKLAKLDTSKAPDYGDVKGDKIKLITPAQFETLPIGAVLYSFSGRKVVKGVDSIDDDTRGGYMAFGVLESHSKEPLGYKKVDITAHAPAGMDFSKNLEWTTGRRDKLTLVTPAQYGQIPDGTLLYDLEGTAFVKGADSQKIGEREGHLMVGFKKAQIESNGSPSTNRPGSGSGGSSFHSAFAPTGKGKAECGAAYELLGSDSLRGAKPANRP